MNTNFGVDPDSTLVHHVLPTTMLFQNPQPNVLGVATPMSSTAGKRPPTTNYYTAETIIFRPLELKLNDPFRAAKIHDVYCKFKLGSRRVKTGSAQTGTTNPTWLNTIAAIERKDGEPIAKIKVKEKHLEVLRETVGETKINLDEVLKSGRTKRWFTLEKYGHPIGKIHVEIEKRSIDI